jgi:hypothetical protein
MATVSSVSCSEQLLALALGRLALADVAEDHGVELLARDGALGDARLHREILAGRPAREEHALAAHLPAAHAGLAEGPDVGVVGGAEAVRDEDVDRTADRLEAEDRVAAAARPRGQPGGEHAAAVAHQERAGAMRGRARRLVPCERVHRSERRCSTGGGRTAGASGGRTDGGDPAQRSRVELDQRAHVSSAPAA